MQGPSRRAGKCVDMCTAKYDWSFIFSALDLVHHFSLHFPARQFAASFSDSAALYRYCYFVVSRLSGPANSLPPFTVFGEKLSSMHLLYIKNLQAIYLMWYKGVQDIKP